MSQALLFSGQGAQKVGMGKSLFDNSPRARELYQQADEILGWKLSKLSFEGPEDALTETRVCQPALYVHGYTVFTLLREAGRVPEPRAALGLSLGELTALAAAGAFDFATGLRVVAERGRLMQEACDASEGTMASIIGGTRDQVLPLCEKHGIDMANLNCPGQIVISGSVSGVESAVVDAKASGLFKMVVPLKVAGAYHSRLMEPARAAFEAFLADVEIRTPQFTVFSNTTGKPVAVADEIRAALVRQIVSSVLWEDCMRGAAALGVDEFIECGVGAVLAGLARRTERTWKVASYSEYADLGLS